MDSGNAAERLQPIATDADTEAVDFVRFCYRRRRVGWPELYDEMCAVAGRGLYRGYGSDELAGIGIGLTLFEMPALAALVQRIAGEDQARRRLIAQDARATVVHAAAIDPTRTEAAAETATATSQVAAASQVTPAPVILAVEPVTVGRGLAPGDRRPAEEIQPQPRLMVVAASA
jgi:hypothetical protein